MKTLTRYLVLVALLTQVVTGTAQIGDAAPDFTVTDTHGEAHQLYDYLDAGKTVVLDFFYTTCIPCQYYTPQVNLAYEKYGCNESEVIFMSIDYNDTDAEVQAYDTQYNIHYPSVSGLDGGGNAVVSAYGIFGFPTFYVVDSTHKIIQIIDPPTLQVFDYRFEELGIEPMTCGASASQDISAVNFNIQLFPNPVASDVIHVLLPGSTKPVGYDICDMMGQIVMSGEITSWMSKEITVSIQDLTPGAYLFHTRALQGLVLSRLLIRY